MTSLPSRMTVSTLADLVEHWPAIVGAPFAERGKVCGFAIDGVLHVRMIATVTPDESAPLSAALLARLPRSLDGVPLRRVRFLPPEHTLYTPPSKRTPK